MISPLSSLARLRARRPRWVPLGALALALLAGFALSASVGAAQLALRELPSALSDVAHPQHALLWDVRLPRIAGGAVVGTALGAAGVLLQTVVRNPLADPGVLGVTAAAGMAGLISIVWFPERGALTPLAALIGGAAAACLLPMASLGAGRGLSPLRIVLTGAALQAFFFAGIALITFLFADRAPAFAAFTVGSLSGIGWRDVVTAAVPSGIGIAAALSLAPALDVLLLDDASAAGVGLAVLRTRLTAAAIAALFAAAAVSCAGLVSFVGLVVPNAVRLWVGPGHRVLLTGTALGGAALVVWADALARTLSAPLELPVGVLLAGIGAPYFLHLLWRKLP